MSEHYQERDARLRFPFAVADNTDGKGVQRIAVTGNAQTWPLPKFWYGKFVYFAVDADGTALTKVQVATATSVQSLTVDQASDAVTSNSSAAAGITVPAGQFIDRALSDGATHLCFRGDAAGGFVEFYLSEIVA